MNCIRTESMRKFPKFYVLSRHGSTIEYTTKGHGSIFLNIAQKYVQQKVLIDGFPPFFKLWMMTIHRSKYLTKYNRVKYCYFSGYFATTCIAAKSSDFSGESYTRNDYISPIWKAIQGVFLARDFRGFKGFKSGATSSDQLYSDNRFVLVMTAVLW